MRGAAKILIGLVEAIRHARGEVPAWITNREAGMKGRPLVRFTRCPHCGSAQFREGPRGGASVNIFCTSCEAGFNVFDIPGGPYLDMEIRPPQKDTTRA